MKKHIAGFRAFVVAAALAVSWFAPSSALAQSNCSYIATGAVLTAAQWNQCFAQKQNTLGYVPVNRAGDIMLGKLTTQAAQVSGAGFNLPQGSAPASPINGDVWITLSGMFARINGVTAGPFGAIGPSSFAATLPLGVTFPAGVVTYALATDANFSTVASQLALASGGIAYPSSVTGGAKGAGTINASGLYINNVAVTAAAITALTGDGTATGPGSAAFTLATVNSNVGACGTSTGIPSVTLNAKGLATACSTNAVIAPAGTLTGATLAANVLASSLTSVGTLTGGATGAGFTVALSVSTITGTLPGANFPALTGDVTTAGGALATTIATNAVTNAKAAQMAAATLKGNPTASTANATDFTIQGLTSLGSPDAVLDFLPIYDHISGTIKNVTPSAIAGSVVAGVASIDAKVGAFTTSNGVTTLVNDIRLASIAADSVLMNATGSSGIPGAVAIPNCTGAAKGLTYDTSAHTWGCTTNTVGTVTSVSVTAGTGITQSGSPVTGSGSITVNVDKATAANYYAAASNKVVTTDIIYPSEVTVTFGSTTTFDFSTFNNAIVTLTANITTQTFSNITAGKAGTIRFQQSGAGSFTTVWNSNLKFAGGTTPTLTTGSATAIDVLNYFCITATYCEASLAKDVK